MVQSVQRDLAKEARWRGLVQRQAASGLTIAAWCRRHHISDALFHYWKRTIARRDGQSTQPGRAAPGVGPRRVSFARVEVQSAESLVKPEADARFPVEIVLANARLVRVGADCDAPTLRRVLAVLEEGPC